jgi:aspartyl-tRNA synthetase
VVAATGNDPHAPLPSIRDIPTGRVEREDRELRILAKSETPLFEIVENSDVKRRHALKYSLSGPAQARHIKEHLSSP